MSDGWGFALDGAAGFMRQRAQRLLQGADAPTLQPTALVHEAYIKLAEAGAPAEMSEEHLKALLASVLRQVLVDHLRRKNAVKRGGGRTRLPLADEAHVTTSHEVDSEEIHGALEELARTDERAARVVELRFFGGLSIAQIARINEVSERTVASDWRYAQAWLRDRLQDRAEGPS